MLNKQSTHRWIMVGVLLLLWGLLLIRFDESFYGKGEEAFAWISASVRAFKEFGPPTMDFLPIYTMGLTDPESATYYLNHPPTMIWLIAMGAELFGYDPVLGGPHVSSIRMVGLIATMLTLPLFYVMARQLVSPNKALLAFIFYAFAPVTLYFGRMPYYDMLIMPVILAFAYVFIQWMHHYNKKLIWMMILLGSIAMWIDWTGAFYFAVFGLIALIYGKREHRIGISIAGIIIGLATLAIIVFYVIVNEDTVTRLQDALFTRIVSENVTLSEQLMWDRFILRYIGHMLQMLAISTTFFGFIGLIIVSLRKKDFNTIMLLSWFIAPFIFMMIARNPWHFHDWYKLHFLPGFAIFASITVIKLWQLKPEGIQRYAKPLVVALIICTFGANVYILYSLNQTLFPFAPALATELPQHTEADDTIGTNFDIRLLPVEYYAYRNISWGVMPETLEAFYQNAEAVDLQYLMCEPFVDRGIFTSYDYILLESIDCRLYHIVKPDTSD
ncbi:MAG: ArnT family glycosyltransferase [Anaerolineae bacterium]